jgi:hypothetical protein
MSSTAVIDVSSLTPDAISKLWGQPKLEEALLEYVRSCIALMPEVVMHPDMKGPVDFINTKRRGKVIGEAETFQVMSFNLNPETIVTRLRSNGVNEVALYKVMCGSDPRMDLYVRGFFMNDLS